MQLLIQSRFQFLIILILFLSNALMGGQLLSSNSVSNNDSFSVYSGKFVKHGSFYNWMWGEHYRHLYYIPIDVSKVNLETWLGGMTFVDHMPYLYGLLFKDQEHRYYLLKTLDAPTSFVESTFFRKIYNRNLYKNTYLGDFIEESATIENPFGFIISDNLARQLDLNTGNIKLVHLQDSHSDTILDGTSINNKLVSIYRLPDLDSLKIETKIDSVLMQVHQNKASVDQDLYIRTRLFDMLIGDWNKIPENWGWLTTGDSLHIVYEPMVLDRSHAFTKVDGVFFKQMLGMLGLGFITNYDAKQPNVSKVNKLGFPLDMALASASTLDDWLEQSHFLKRMLTDSLIDETFKLLPTELQVPEFELLKQDIRARRDKLDETAKAYYKQLQKNPIIVAENDFVVIEGNQDKDLRIRLFDNKTGDIFFDKLYKHHSTKEIWLYTLGKNNRVKINKPSKAISVSIIDPTGTNSYEFQAAQTTQVYRPSNQSETTHEDNVDKQIRTFYVKDTLALQYDYQKYRYTKFAFMPIGVYDSDLGLNIGTSVSYTIYGFLRNPFTQQHQLSYNYSSGFMYQGIFPAFNSKTSFNLFAFASNTSSFYNFFGLGNETDGFNGKNKEYNRVHIDKYFVTPSINYTIDNQQKINIAASFQNYKVKNPDGHDRYINIFYQDDEDIFKTKNFFELDLTYRFRKEMDSFLSTVNLEFNPGWILNLSTINKNVPFAALNVGLNFKLNSRLTLATLMKGKALFSNDYEFYQAATADLRGFRTNRFAGKQSFYEYTDLRLDMGRLENPFTPTSYGLFIGVDHGRVWYPDEDSKKWYASFGGGFWLTIFKQFTGKFSYFVSNEDEKRFMFELGLSF